MKVPVFILSAGVGAVLMIQAWTLNTIVELKAEVASIKTELQFTNHLSKN